MVLKDNDLKHMSKLGLEFINKAKIQILRSPDCIENIQTGLRRQICTGIWLSSTSVDKKNGQIYQLDTRFAY